MRSSWLSSTEAETAAPSVARAEIRPGIWLRLLPTVPQAVLLVIATGMATVRVGPRKVKRNWLQHRWHWWWSAI